MEDWLTVIGAIASLSSFVSTGHVHAEARSETVSMRSGSTATDRSVMPPFLGLRQSVMPVVFNEVLQSHCVFGCCQSWPRHLTSLTNRQLVSAFLDFLKQTFLRGTPEELAAYIGG